MCALSPASTSPIAKDSKYWRDAHRALAEATGKHFQPAHKAAAARDLAATTPSEKALAERCYAEEAYAAADTPASRLRMAKARNTQGQYNRALATVGTAALNAGDGKGAAKRFAEVYT